jgi:ATP-dependent helicase HepA
MAARKQLAPLTVGDWATSKSEGYDSPGPWRVVAVNGDDLTVASSSYPDKHVESHRSFRRRDLVKIDKIDGLSVWYPLRGGSVWIHGTGLIRDDDRWLLDVDNYSEPQWIDTHDVANSDEYKVWIKEFLRSPNPIEMLGRGMATKYSQIQIAREYRKWLGIQQRASAGFSAIMSAPIKPAHHQLNVMARVLGDPRLRFLLADEVGLGKTIQAGLILRQLFLDDNVSKTAVVVPGPLMRQWERELGQKLNLQRLVENGSIQILSHEEISAVGNVDVLVVDEAHRFCRNEIHESLFESVEAAAVRTPHLLLLSATPLRSDPIALLQLLTLVDSRNYSMNDEEGFHHRFDARIAQARALGLLRGSVSKEIRKVLVQNIREHIPPDEVIESLLEVVTSEENQSPKLDSAISSLRTEIEERFRISRRVVRNRRSAIDPIDYPLPSRLVNLIEFRSFETNLINEFIESWRERSQENNWSTVWPVFLEMIHHALAGATTLLGWIRTRSTDLRNSVALPIFDTELNFLSEYLYQFSGKMDRADLVIQYISNELQDQESSNRKAEKIVVSTGFPTQAEYIYKGLHDEFGSRIVSHLASRSHVENDSDVIAFSSDNQVQVLVIDSSAEEGLNLQIADKMVNIDLPWSVNRLEQRLGRTDRFTDGKARDAQYCIYVEPDNKLLMVFIDFLKEATGIFEESVATAQKSLARLSVEFAECIWLEGLDYINVDFQNIRSQIEYEKDEVMELEDLESQSAFGDYPADLYQLLQDFEDNEDETTLGKPFENALEYLGIKQTMSSIDSKVFEYQIDKSLKRTPRIPAVRQGYVQRNLAKLSTLSRPQAINHPGTELIRIGNSMVETIDALFRKDDQCKVAIGWNSNPELIRPFIEVDLEVEICPDFSYLREIIPRGDLRRVRRRVSSTFPDQIITLRFSDTGEIISDDNAFWEPYVVSLNGRSLQEAIDRRGSFIPLVDLILENYEKWVMADISEKVSQAVEHSLADYDRRLKSLKTWRSGSVIDEIRIETDIYDELVYALENPKMQILSLAVVIHSHEPLEVFE